jgi:uncharacterized membrane protein YeaQ/YmgE (transglycosylase-associated protein family)
MTGSSSTTRIRKGLATESFYRNGTLLPSRSQVWRSGSHVGDEPTLAQGTARKEDEMGIITWIIFGFIVGLIARAVVPGKQGMGLVMTTLLGVAGSLIGGLVASALGRGDVTGFHPTGFIGSLIGAVVLLVIAGMVTSPKRRPV